MDKIKKYLFLAIFGGLFLPITTFAANASIDMYPVAIYGAESSLVSGVFAWKSKNITANSCKAFGDWSGAVGDAGSRHFRTDHSLNFTIVCKNPIGGIVIDNFVVPVLAESVPIVEIKDSLIPEVEKVLAPTVTGPSSLEAGFIGTWKVTGASDNRDLRLKYQVISTEDELGAEALRHSVFTPDAVVAVMGSWKNPGVKNLKFRAVSSNGVASDWVVKKITITNPEPILDIVAATTTVDYKNPSTTISWRAINVSPDSCTVLATSPFNFFPKDTLVLKKSDSDFDVPTGTLLAQTSYALSCKKLDQKTMVSDKVTINVSVPNPTISLKSATTQVAYNSPASLTWSATNIQPGSCIISSNDSWEGIKADSGNNIATGKLTKITTFTLKCSNLNGTVSTSTSVVVQPLPQAPITKSSANTSTVATPPGTKNIAWNIDLKSFLAGKKLTPAGGTKFIFSCPRVTSIPSGNIYGGPRTVYRANSQTDVYYTYGYNSSICLAGLHSGKITLSGGIITVYYNLPATKALPISGTTKNGVTSKTFNDTYSYFGYY